MKLTGKFRKTTDNKTVKKIIIFGVIAFLCAGVAAIVITLHPQKDGTKNKVVDKTKGMPVSVRTTSPGDYPAEIMALGEVVPHYRSIIKARVGGRISFLSIRLKVGTIVHAGEVLISIEKSHFTMEVAEAESRLKTARLTVLKEEKEAKDAKKNWERSGIKGAPHSLLVLREPHLEAARAELNAAKKSLENARTQLGHTDVKAPYDGVIMERSVNPGETVFAGEEVAIMYSLDAVEVGVRLDTSQWDLLSTPINITRARLTDPGQKAAWDAAVVRVSKHLDRETRLRTLFLEVRDPLNQNPPLLPGTFVRVAMTGKKMAGLFCIPEQAQTKEGVVWFVDSRNRLTSHRTEPIFYGQGLVYIKNPKPEEKAVKVAISPNSGFINGLLVQPVEDKEDN